MKHEETPGFQNFAASVFCPLGIVRGTGVCRTYSEVGHLVQSVDALLQMGSVHIFGALGFY